MVGKPILQYVTSGAIYIFFFSYKCKNPNFSGLDYFHCHVQLMCKLLQSHYYLFWGKGTFKILYHSLKFGSQEQKK